MWCLRPGVHPSPGGAGGQGGASSTLSFLDNVAPSERFSPLENSLTTSRVGAGSHVKCSLGATSATAGAPLVPAAQSPADVVFASVASALNICTLCHARYINKCATLCSRPWALGSAARRLHLGLAVLLALDSALPDTVRVGHHQIADMQGSRHAEVGDSGVPGGPIPEVQRPSSASGRLSRVLWQGCHTVRPGSGQPQGSKREHRQEQAWILRPLLERSSSRGHAEMSETGAAAHPAARPFACLGRLFRTGQHPHP